MAGVIDDARNRDERIVLPVRRAGINNRNTDCMTCGSYSSPHESDPSARRVAVYPGNAGSEKTQLYIVMKVRHTRAGRPPYLPEMLIGKAGQAFSAMDVIRDSFNSCPPG
jgi:hypothetical protein